MYRTVVIVSLAVGAGLSLKPAAEPPRLESARSIEVRRLKSHFDSVDAELKSRSVATLTGAQRARRARLTSWLREYRNAGQFPVNDKFEAPTPFFRDSKGTLCAMAYLIDRSGRKDIVEKVEAPRNTAYIAELADDPALLAWLDSSGLTVDEAARIQPAYDGGPWPNVPDRERGVDSDFALAAVGLGGASLAATAINVVKPSYVSGLLGILAGAVSIGVAANNFDENRGTDRVATATIGLGALSLGAGVYGLLDARRGDDDDDWDRRRGRGRNRFSLIVMPDVVLEKSDPRVGMRLSGKF